MFNKNCLVLSICFVLFGATGVAWGGEADKHFANALNFRFQGNTEAAIKEYERGLALEPMSASNHAQLGILLLDEKGDVDGAISEFVTALGIDPCCKFCQEDLSIALMLKNSQTNELLERGNQYYSSGDLLRAQAAYRIAEQIDPGDADVHNSLAWVLYRLGSLDEGLKEAKTALELKPKDPEFINTLGCLFLDKGETMMAASFFRQAVALCKVPNPADLYGLAIVALGKHDKGLAAKYYNQAIKIDPNYIDAAYLRDHVGLSAKTLASHSQLVSIVSSK